MKIWLDEMMGEADEEKKMSGWGGGEGDICRRKDCAGSCLA
jgi:hypothetical protein